MNRELLRCPKEIIKFEKSSQVWKVENVDCLDEIFNLFMSSLLVKGLVGMNEGVELWGGRKDELLTLKKDHKSNLRDLKGFISHFHHTFFIFIRIIIISINIIIVFSDIIMIWILYTDVSLYSVFFRVLRFSLSEFLFSFFRTNIFYYLKIPLFSELILFRSNI